MRPRKSVASSIQVQPAGQFPWRCRQLVEQALEPQEKVILWISLL